MRSRDSPRRGQNLTAMLMRQHFSLRAMEGCEQRKYLLRFTFLTAHWCCCVESRLEEGEGVKAGSPLRRLFHDSRYKTLKTWIRVETREMRGDAGSGICLKIKLRGFAGGLDWGVGGMWNQG